MDQFDVVRAFYAALNRREVEAAAALYDPSCITEDVFPGEQYAVVRGREENFVLLREFIDRFEGGFDDGAYFRVRTIGGIGTGWGWVQARWSHRVRERATGTETQSAGYSHFLVEDGLIRRHRSIVQNEVTAVAASGEVGSGRHYPAKPVVGIGAVVLASEAGRERMAWKGPMPHPCGVVLIKRKYEPLAGQWSLPGGTLELGETLEAGVAREVEEETGLVVSVGPVVEVFDRILFDEDHRVRYHFVLIDYLCEPQAGRLRFGSDVSDVTIADPARLEEYGLTAKAEGVIRRALQIAGHD